MTYYPAPYEYGPQVAEVLIEAGGESSNCDVRLIHSGGTHANRFRASLVNSRRVGALAGDGKVGQVRDRCGELVVLLGAERVTTVFTPNKGFEEWGEIFGDEVTAVALIDRVAPPLPDPRQQLPHG